jgi:hypothetical protein
MGVMVRAGLFYRMPAQLKEPECWEIGDVVDVLEAWEKS